MVFKDFCVLMLWTKVASALEGLTYATNQIWFQLGREAKTDQCGFQVIFDAFHAIGQSLLADCMYVKYALVNFSYYLNKSILTIFLYTYYHLSRHSHRISHWRLGRKVHCSTGISENITMAECCLSCLVCAIIFIISSTLILTADWSISLVYWTVLGY